MTEGQSSTYDVPDGNVGLTNDRKTQQQRREETHSKLIKAAIKLIQEDGCANLTTAKVATAAGLTRGAIQYHFSSPKDLLREVIITIVQKLNTMVAEADLNSLEKPERLDQLIDSYWEGYQSGIYVVFLEIAMQGHRDPELRQSIEEAIGSLEQERDDQWLGFFQDYAQSKEDILNWRASLLVLLRGLAVKKMFSNPDEDLNGHYLRAKGMFREFIAEESSTD